MEAVYSNENQPQPIKGIFRFLFKHIRIFFKISLSIFLLDFNPQV